MLENNLVVDFYFKNIHCDSNDRWKFEGADFLFSYDAHIVSLFFIHDSFELAFSQGNNASDHKHNSLLR